MELKERVAIVTGCTKGIGRAITERLIAEGMKVVGCARHADELDVMAARMGESFLGIPADVRHKAECEGVVRRTLEHFGRLDVLINNAGVGIFKELHELTDEEWDQVMETNVTGLFYMTRAALRHMYQQGEGYVINISSLAGKYGFPKGTVYCASKFAVNGLSESLFQEARNYGVKVSYICPGSVSTFFSGKDPSALPEEERLWKIQPEDVAELVVELLTTSDHVLISRVEMRPAMTRWKKPERQG